MTTGVQISISGTPVMVLEGSFEVDDAINSISTCKFTVRDDTGTQFYTKFQEVSITDSVKGLYYTGFIDTVQRQRQSPNLLIFSQVACRDNHAIPERRTYQGPEYTGEYAGVIYADMLSGLSADGITAQYATQRETTQAQLATGTLSNTRATSNVDDGDLELSLAGSVYTKAESTATDFNAGTLTNVTGTSSGLTMTSSSVLKYTGNASANIGGNLYAYTEFNGTNAAIGSSYVFSYDIFIASTSPAIACGVDFICTDGTSFRDSGIRDAYGFLAHPSTVMDGYANDQWYHRDFQLTTNNTDFNGKTIDYVQVGFEGEATGTYTAYIDNVVLKNSGGTVIQTYYSSGSPQSNKRLGTQGYSGVKLSNVTAYQSMGQRVSPAYDFSIAGIVQSSLISWSTPAYSQPLASNSSNYPAPVVVESSIDGGATWQGCTLGAPIPNLPAGLSASSRTVTLRQTLNLAGPDPTIAPVLTECTFTVNPSYTATKSDITDSDTSSGDFATGTLTNVAYSSSAGGEQITGSYRSWDDGSFANQTSYGNPSGDPNASIENGQFSLRVDSGPFEMRSRFDFAGNTWQNFILECDIAHFSDITSNLNNGIVYRTTGWQNNNDTYAYSLQLEATSIALVRGTNSSSGGGSSTLISRVAVAFEASKYYHIKLVVNGSSHQAYVNDILYINATDSTFSAAGYVGVRLYNNSAARNSAFFDNFGIMSSAFTGHRVHPSLSLTSLGSVYGSLIQWNSTEPGNTTLLIESSINGGSTWATCTSGAVIPQLTNGTSVSGVSLLIRETLTTQNANATPVLAGISVFVMGAYSSSGTRVSSSLSLANVGRMGSSVVAWNSTLPTNTALGVDVAIDGGSWTDVTSSNGGTIPGLTGQPSATDDSYTGNTAANYTSTHRTGGSNATWTYDTPHSRITATGGSSALFVWNSVTGVSDVDLFIDMDESDTGGVIWRYADVNNFYELVVQDSASSSTHNIVALFKTVAGTRTQIGSNTAISFTRNTYHRIHVNMQGTAIVITVDNIQAMSTTDASLASGKTGLRTSGVTARFLQLWVQPLGQDVSAHSVQTRLRLSSTDPTATPQVPDVTLAAFGNTIQLGALIPQTNYNGKYYSDNFDDLVKQCSATGGQWWWYFDKNKTAYLLPNAGLPAPWIASSVMNPDGTGDFLEAGLTVTDASDNYCNRVIIENVTATTIINESRIGDGFARSWSFGYEWASAPTIRVNGTLASVGVKGVDAGKMFYYAVGDNTITIDASVATFTNTSLISFYGTGQYLTKSEYNNEAEQAAVAALDGTTGIVEYVEDGTGLTQAAGDARAQAVGIKNSVRGQKIDATSLRDGLTPGMLVPVIAPEHNINDGAFLLRSMKTTLTPDGTTGLHRFWYQLELINGPDVGDWTMLYQKSGNFASGTTSNNGSLFMSSIFYNVKDYGATGNGTTDDTSAIQAAMNAAAGAGDVAYLPPGTYVTSASLVMTGDNMILRGSGWNSVIQPVSGASFDVISTPIPASAGLAGYVRNYIGIEQLMIDCSNMTGTVAGQGNGIHWYGVRYSFIRDVYVKSCDNWAILTDGDNTGPGNNFGYDVQIMRCVFDLCNAGVWVTNSEAQDIVECRFKWGGAACSALQPALGTQDTNALHLRCSGGYMYIAGNIFGKGGAYTTPAIRSENNGPCRIVGNRFDQVRNQAVTLNGGNHMVIGNQFGSPGSAISGVPGVQLGSSNNLVMGNKFDTTAGAMNCTYNVAEAGGPFTGNKIIANDFIAGTSGVISLNATSTAKVRDNTGYNPVGVLGPPTVPATTVAYTNNYGVDCTVFIKGGTLTVINVGGSATGIAAAAATNTAHTIRVPTGQTISITYTVAPTWVWMGD